MTRLAWLDVWYQNQCNVLHMYKMTREGLALSTGSSSSELDLLEHTLQAFPSLLAILFEVEFEFSSDAFEGIVNW